MPQNIYRYFDTDIVTMTQSQQEKQVYKKNGVKITATENGTYFSCHFNLAGLRQGYTEQIRKDKFELLMTLGEFKRLD